MSSVNISVIFGKRYNKEAVEKTSKPSDLRSDGSAVDKCCLGYKEQTSGFQGDYISDVSSCVRSLDV